MITIEHYLTINVNGKKITIDFDGKIVNPGDLDDQELKEIGEYLKTVSFSKDCDSCKWDHFSASHIDPCDSCTSYNEWKQSD